MSDRPTPETEVQNMLYHNGSCWVDVSFSKQLERQRDEARELLAKALIRGDEALEVASKARKDLAWSDIQDKRELVRERDEALDLARELRDALRYAVGNCLWRADIPEQLSEEKAQHIYDTAIKALTKAREAGL